jgi:hypothetical protein
VRIDIAYEFDKSFAPVISLPFPLVASSKALSGLKVTGLSLDYPEDHPVDDVILQVQGDTGPYLFAQITTLLRLGEFELSQELAKL